jgi:ankyrin repeat protein
VRNLDLMETMLKIGLNPNLNLDGLPTQSSRFDHTFLMHAVKTDDKAMCQLLLKYGANVNGTDKHGNSTVSNQILTNSCFVLCKLI